MCVYVYMNKYEKLKLAEVGSISARAKMTIKTFVKRVITIFATNALFLRVIARGNDKSKSYKDRNNG